MRIAIILMLLLPGYKWKNTVGTSGAILLWRESNSQIVGVCIPKADKWSGRVLGEPAQAYPTMYACKSGVENQFLK